MRIVMPAILCFCALAAAAGPQKKFVFEERQIEGKIRRPQLVLITADQRPQYGPMVMIAAQPVPGDHAEPEIAADCYAGPFRFDEGGLKGLLP